MSEEHSASPEKKSSNRLWDTHYCKQSEAFSIFREGICSTFMPWSPEFKSEQPFEGRLEGISLEQGSIARAQMSPIICVRTKANIARSPLDGFYANFVLSGELMVEQAGRTNVVKKGELVVYDSSLPVTLTERADAHYDDIAILIPKKRYSAIPDAEGHLGNTLIGRKQMIGPLLSCLTLVAENVATLSREEWAALFDACIALLPVAAGCFDDVAKSMIAPDTANSTFHQILSFVNHNLSKRELCPSWVAEQFGISCRYVQQLFAARGVTFSGYVLGKRLEQIRADMLSPTCRKWPIRTLVNRWGLDDLVSFERAFARQFGCAPSLYRERLGR